MDRIYLDYAATTPVDPAVIELMQPYFFEIFGNPSSPHIHGQQADAALESARESVATFIGTRSANLIFNSGTTEGANHAISGVVFSLMERGDHILISAAEHSCVRRPAEHLAGCGFDVEIIPVDSYGRVDPEDIRQRITSRTILIALTHASNEVGTIQPISETGAIARERGVPFLVDACQSVGHIPVDVETLNADILLFSAHKFYGPKGVGGMYVRPGTPLSPFFFGGDQERGRRASTQNVAGVVGMAKALEMCAEIMAIESATQQTWSQRLMREISQNVSGVKINGDQDNRLPNNVHVAFEGIDGSRLLAALDARGISAAMGSACASGSIQASPVLTAMGLSDDLARGALRLTCGRWTTEKHIEYVIDILPSVVASLRK